MAIGQNQTITQRVANNAQYDYQTSCGNVSVEKIVISNQCIVDPKYISPGLGVIINNDDGYNT